jgi:hypothetical protein
LKSNICHDKELLLLPCKVIQGIYWFHSTAETASQLTTSCEHN